MQTRSTLTQTREPGTDGKPFVLVLGPGIFNTYELPTAGSFLIGRHSGADVWVDDPLLSAEHARINVNSGCFVEDLGSRNGTFLKGERLPSRSPQLLPPGEAIAAGSCLIVVHEALPAPRGRRAVSYGFFRIRLDEELARARHEPTRCFSIARVQVLSQIPADDVASVAVRTMRSFDTFAAYAPDDYSLLFAQTEADDARRVVAEFCSTLSAGGALLRSGIARYPEDGRTAQQLEAHCLRMLRPGFGSTEAQAMVSASPIMQQLMHRADRAANSQISVLITGETGSGKDVLARYIHAHSPRSQQPFQAINCAALPEALLESQLFGYERGAFTGATRASKGLIESANGGTVFLDEIAEIPLMLQAKLLRLVENGEVQTLGSTRVQKVDVRFIAATNVDLVQAVAAQRFRADLLYRLKGLELRVPALRERPADIPVLAREVLARVAVLEGMPAPPALEEAAKQRLIAYAWPGNVRELGNVLHRALILSDRHTITEDELLFDPEPTSPEPSDTSDLETLPQPNATKPSQRVSNPSRRELLAALSHCGGNQSRAAELLGVPRKRLRDLVRFYDLPLPRG